jgi:hypothetical protein
MLRVSDHGFDIILHRSHRSWTHRDLDTVDLTVYLVAVPLDLDIYIARLEDTWMIIVWSCIWLKSRVFAFQYSACMCKPPVTTSHLTSLPCLLSKTIRIRQLAIRVFATSLANERLKKLCVEVSTDLLPCSHIADLMSMVMMIEDDAKIRDSE